MFRNYKWERVVGTEIKPKYAVKNELFATTNDVFMEACKQAKVKNTTRMASKWRNKKGLAYGFKAVAKTIVAGKKKEKK